MAVAKKTETASGGLLKVGDIVSLERSGRTLTGLEVLAFDEHFVKFRWNIQVSPQQEIVLVPWGKIESLGLEGER